MQKRNYQKEMEGVIASLSRDAAPGLLLHSCCAPCSSYVLEYLSRYFEITLFYYNPNIDPPEEYQRRLAEQKRLLAALPVKHPVTLIAGDYDPLVYADAVRGVEDTPEGGQRCKRCIARRLEEAAKLCLAQGCHWFTTTLTISPHKDAPFINACGTALAEKYGVRFLPSDFKKRGGYQRSIQLSGIYQLYRQDFCGCIYSRQEAEQRRMRKTTQTETA